MRHFLRILSLAGAIALAVFGVTTMQSSGDLAALLPASNTTVVDYVDKEVEAPATNLTMNTPVDLSTTGDTNLYYEHSDGFEGTAAFEHAATTEKVITDEQGRVSRIFYRLTPDNNMMYATGPSDNKSVFAPHAFTTGGTEIGITAYAWRNAVHPILSNIVNWVNKASSDAIVVIDLSYNEATEVYPRYIRIRAYSPEDDGVALNVNTDVYNYDKDIQVDYERGTTAASESSTTSSASDSASNADKTTTSVTGVVSSQTTNTTTPTATN